MELRFVAPALSALDGLRCDALIVPIAEDERPLRRTAGLVDWRLAGALSRLASRGVVRGAVGERILVPARPRLAVDKVVLLGTGASAAFDDAVFVATIAAAIDVLAGLRARTAALALPGRAIERIGPERALELFLEHAADPLSRDEITILDGADAQRVMLPVLERARRRARARESG